MRPTQVPGIAFRFLLPIVAVVCGLSFLFDNAVIAWVGAHQTPQLSSVGRFFTRWGDFPPIVALLVLLLLGAWLLKLRFAVRLLIIMLGSAVVGGLMANIFRVLSGRTRPSAKVPPGWYGLKAHGVWIAGNYSYSSFPSAHTAVAFSCIVPLWLLLPRRLLLPIALPATIIAACIGASRIVLNAHHLSDVLCSVFLAMIVGTLLCRRFGAVPKAG